ncbi:MAG: sel1 repeat family protein, partial [Alphaproteobacteria bacterium]|nr:sel1 repeat family protein [Alphaproteobacteria bacterium]
MRIQIISRFFILGMTLFNNYIYATVQQQEVIESAQEIQGIDEKSEIEHLIKRGEASQLGADKETDADLKQAFYYEAFLAYQQAANKGNAEAQCLLGRLYKMGQGVKQSETDAVKWYSLASNQDHPRAQYLLASLYEEGKGTPKEISSQSNEIAQALYTKAFENFTRRLPTKASHQCTFGLMYLNHKGHQVDDLSEEDDILAAYWFNEAAMQGYSPAQFSLGYIYSVGQGVAQNNEIALQWFQKAAEQGNAEAQVNLVVMYAEGQGVTQNNEIALEWFQ